MTEFSHGNITPVFDMLLDWYSVRRPDYEPIIIVLVYGYLWRNSRNPGKIVYVLRDEISEHLYIPEEIVNKVISILEEDGFISCYSGMIYQIDFDLDIENTYNFPDLKIHDSYLKKERQQKRLAILAKTGGRCSYCGIELIDYNNPEHIEKYYVEQIRGGEEVLTLDYKLVSNTFEIDHFIPRSRGGTDDFSNLVPSCAKCNHKKHTNLWELGKVGVQNNVNK